MLAFNKNLNCNLEREKKQSVKEIFKNDATVEKLEAETENNFLNATLQNKKN